MAEGYNVSRDESSWQDLDEFLCEYVDGSMDPVVREVFEEYVLQNPDLAKHVECLCEAKRLLSRAHCPCQLNADFVQRLRQRLSVEAASRRETVLPGVYSGLAHLTALTSALLVVTMLGMMVGALLADPEPERQSTRSSVLAADRASSPRFSRAVQFSSLFVAPDARVLNVGSDRNMTPVVPRRLPIVPLWADADWRSSSSPAMAAAW